MTWGVLKGLLIGWGTVAGAVAAVAGGFKLRARARRRRTARDWQREARAHYENLGVLVAAGTVDAVELRRRWEL